MHEPVPGKSVNGPEASPGLSPARTPDAAEVARLQQDFLSSQSGLDQARSVLKTAQAIKAGHAMFLDTPAFRAIDQRLQRGENMDQIVESSSAQVRTLHESSLDAELPFREAHAALLRSEVGSSVSDEDILRVVSGLEHKNAFRLSDPAYREINRRKLAGESIDDIRSKAQQAVDGRQRASALIHMAEAMKNPRNARPLDMELQSQIDRRLQAGESLDDIISKSNVNLAGYAETDRKRGDLRQVESRIDDIRREKQVIAGQKQQEQNQLAQQQLRQVRGQLGNMSS